MRIEHIKGHSNTVYKVGVRGIWILLWHIHVQTSVHLLVDFAYSLGAGDILVFVGELVCKFVCCFLGPKKHHAEFVVWAGIKKLKITRVVLLSIKAAFLLTL